MAEWSCRCGAKNDTSWRYCEGCGAENPTPAGRALSLAPKSPAIPETHRLIRREDPPAPAEPTHVKAELAKLFAKLKEPPPAHMSRPESVPKRLRNLVPPIDQAVRRAVDG